MSEIPARSSGNSLRIPCLLLSCLALFAAADSWALDLNQGKKSAEKTPYITVTPKDRCPVCGMFVHPFQKWITQIQFEDGSHHSFDGMKCMCRLYLAPEQYDAAKKKEDIRLVLVRDYYTLRFIRHDTAFYVVGSDVLGPMGHELIPFESEQDARTFLHDHNGVKILRFNEITFELLDKLDKAKKNVTLD